jgi:hypothetical protein
MLRELYYFDLNTTDKQIQQQKNSNFEELERMWWEDTNEIFSTWENIAVALFRTARLIKAIVLGQLFLGVRHLIKNASKLILVWTAPELANQISTWGEDEREPWTLELIHEKLITK